MKKYALNPARLRFGTHPVLTRLLVGLLVGLLLMVQGIPPARAAERARVEAFLTVTGFDVMLDSIALSAGNAPQMLGMQPDAFGADWNRLTKEVFDTALMRSMALDILEATLSDTALSHAAAFYASDLGQRLVQAENASHRMRGDSGKRQQGERIVAELVARGATRLNLIKRMLRAIDASETSLRAAQEVQIRFLLAASAAGVVELKVDGEQLRALLKQQEGPMRLAIQKSALAGSAYTYRDFSDADIGAYAEALETPEMELVYELLNAVQYEIMADRFEALARRMADLHPGQDI